MVSRASLDYSMTNQLARCRNPLSRMDEELRLVRVVVEHVVAGMASRKPAKRPRVTRIDLDEDEATKGSIVEWVTSVTRTTTKHAKGLGKTRHRVHYEEDRTPQIVGPTAAISRLEREELYEADNAVLDDEEIQYNIGFNPFDVEYDDDVVEEILREDDSRGLMPTDTLQDEDTDEETETEGVNVMHPSLVGGKVCI